MSDDDADDVITGFACFDVPLVLMRGPTPRQILRSQRRQLLTQARALTTRVRSIERRENRTCDSAKKAARGGNMLEARRQALDIVRGRAEHARLMVQRTRFENLASRLERESNSLELDEGMQRVVASVGARLATMPPEHFSARIKALEDMDERERKNDVVIERVFSTMVADETKEALDAIGIDDEKVSSVLVELGIIDAQLERASAPSQPPDSNGGAGGGGGGGGQQEKVLQQRLDVLADAVPAPPLAMEASEPVALVDPAFPAPTHDVEDLQRRFDQLRR